MDAVQTSPISRRRQDGALIEQHACSLEQSSRPRPSCASATQGAVNARPHLPQISETSVPTLITTEQPRALPKSLRVITNLFVVTVCVLTFAFTTMGFLFTMVPGRLVGARDFTVFWATGQQLAHHANPYDGNTLLRVEQAAGLGDKHGPMYMRNPPSSLPLVYPLGFLGLWPASVLWSVLLLACLVVSVHMLWVMHGRPKNHRHWIGYTFGPALLCMIMGQSSVFVLLGLVLFLRLHRTRPFLAGIALWPCALKPHLFLPFGVALLAWVVVSRSYKILIGAAVAIAASSAIALLIDPQAWTQYAQMIRTSGIQSDFIPCVSVMLRKWISERTVWLQYLPAVLACIWAMGYYWSRRSTWDWMKNGSLLMVVSLVAAPYSWIYDACILIPALLQGAYVTRSRGVLLTLAFLSALVEVALAVDILKPAAIFLWTIWIAPAWLAWYLVATMYTGTKTEGIPGGAVISD
jgi:hypothetical protein